MFKLSTIIQVMSKLKFINVFKIKNLLTIFKLLIIFFIFIKEMS